MGVSIAPRSYSTQAISRVEEYLPRQIRKCEKIADGKYLMDGRLSIHEVNDVLELDLPTTEFHTIGGMIVARLHHLAHQGESIMEGGYRFTVEDATSRTVLKVRVEREPLG